ncbi:hypothetical protein D8674_039818 [Pyrus ussuriensis x Pyrus communis]|uniref:Uncharacterized protein n=1 Tax=Pyrus ussuriensis x Pyrus communis TaxID=2448454 RepID=A0A5N5FC19_9ROSA|nr:hypothetical protein D8674_039818 [Pyrus ussuriensis x Pyrus communis]
MIASQARSRTHTWNLHCIVVAALFTVFFGEWKPLQTLHAPRYSRVVDENAERSLRDESSKKSMTPAHNCAESRGRFMNLKSIYRLRSWSKELLHRGLGRSGGGVGGDLPTARRCLINHDIYKN